MPEATSYKNNMLNDQSKELGQIIPLHYHFQMLSDKNRMEAFQRAIELSVKKGDQVIDLGSGTGVMSFFSAKQGAKVKAIEMNPALVKKSKDLIEDNGLYHHIELVEKDARTLSHHDKTEVVL